MVRKRWDEGPAREGKLNYVSLSKSMSKALRHRPERIGITLAPDGSVEVKVLVDALNRRGGWPREITEADVVEVTEHGSKRRFAIEGGRIRALYGHTLDLPIAYERGVPPQVLFHGTAQNSLESIMVEGLLPMGRKCVHLSVDVATARQVGARHGGRPVVLKVDAGRAHRDGIAFYRGNDETWLAEAIGACYLTLMGTGEAT